MTRKWILRSACCALALAIVASSNVTFGQQPAKIKMARLAFPSMSSLLIDVLTERGIDRKHQLEFETVSQNAVPRLLRLHRQW